MDFPHPVPGLVIRYSYLWKSEHEKGREDGVKDRPCAIILAAQDVADKQIVTVLPVTHSPTGDPSLALEIPAPTKARLGLDSERSWVVVSEANQFGWPGPDLRRAISDNSGSVAYGMLPEWFIRQLRARFAEAVRAHRASLVRRTE